MGGVVHGAHLLMLFGLIGMSAASEEEEVKPTTYEVVSRLPVAYTGIKTSDGPAACTASAGDVGCVQQLKTALDMTQRSTHLPPVCAGPQASSETGCLRFPKGNSTIKATVDRYGLQQKNYDVRWLPHSEATGGMKLTESPFEVDNVFAVGDYNNDGHLDLLVGANTANKLYRNEGSGKLALIKHAGNEIQDSTGEVAMWCDFDSDGYLDALMKSGIHWNNAGTGDFTAEATHSFKGSSDPTIDNIDGPCGDIDGDGVRAEWDCTALPCAPRQRTSSSPRPGSHLPVASHSHSCVCTHARARASECGYCHPDRHLLQSRQRASV